MAVTITINRIGAEQTAVIVEGTITVTGNYTTGGDTVDWTGNNSTIVYAAEAAQQANQIPSNLGPLGLVEIDEQPPFGTTPQGYIPYLIAGSTMANWLLYIATSVGQPPNQLGAGAYPAGMLATTFQFRVPFNYGV